MKRKTTTTPTRIYSYGCLRPIDGGELLEEQFRLAHQYKNTLIEIEHRRRDQLDRVINAWSDELSTIDCAPVLALEEQYKKHVKVHGDKVPASAALREQVRAARGSLYADVLNQIAARLVTEVPSLEAILVEEQQADDRLMAALASLKAKRAGAGKKADTAFEQALVKQEREHLRQIRARKNAERERLRSPTLQCAQRAITDKSNEEMRKARVASGLYPATYLKVEESVAQAIKTSFPARPRFSRFDGTGKIAVQFNGRTLSVSEVFTDADTRLRIAPLPEDCYQRRRHHRRLASRTTLKIRAGSNEDRSPKWVTFPIILHRPMPSDAVIKWAWVVRKRVGLRYEYRFQVAMESATFEAPEQPCGTGRVALNYGWRNRPDETIRVAYWVDDQGRSGEFLVPLRTQMGMQKPRDLRAIRDKMLDDIRGHVVVWRDANVATASSDWHMEQLKYVHQWRAPRKFAWLLTKWEKEHRINGDEQIIEKLCAWAKQDRHLYAWEANQSDRRLNHRREEYRKIAVRLARTYAEIVAPKINFRKFGKQEKPEHGVPSEGRDQRYTAKLAAPGQLRDAIKAAAQKHGAAYVEMESKHITQSCHRCGDVRPWDASLAIEHRCAGCDAVWDQDANACMNLLKQAPPSGQVPLEDNAA